MHLPPALASGDRGYPMTEPADRYERRRWRGGQGCGCGCGGFLLVLTVGIVLALLGTDLGVGLSIRVPFTSSNLTVAGSIGAKGKAVSALPAYTQDRVAGNQNLINHTSTMTVGPAEGIGIVVLGRQPGSPAIDVHLTSR